VVGSYVPIYNTFVLKALLDRGALFFPIFYLWFMHYLS